MARRKACPGATMGGAVLGAAAVWLVLVGCARTDPDAQTDADWADDAAATANAAAEAEIDTPSKVQPADDAAEAADDPPVAVATSDKPQRADQFGPLGPPDEEQFPGLKRLEPDFDVWIDPDGKRVVLRGGVCLREGPLELFACIHHWVEDEFAEGGIVRRGTKEYESVVTVNTSAAHVHAALLAVGAEPGSPVRFSPEYQPASGTPIEVLLHWEGKDGERHNAKAQEWVRNVKTGDAMEHSWVFAGSGFLVNEETGERRYLGEAGNLICVSNFPDAVMDIPIQSSSANEALLFEAFTERIPPVGTPVSIVLVPEVGER